jgi:hypothetical protein
MGSSRSLAGSGSVARRLLAVTLALLALVSSAVPVSAQDEPAPPAPAAPSSPVPSPGTASPDAEGAAPATDPAGTAAGVALVPVVDAWSERRWISTDGIRRALEGGHPDFDGVRVAVEDLEGFAAGLGITLGPDTQAASAGRTIRATRGDDRALGLVPAGAVDARVRALAVDGLTLFGSERVLDLAAWPLVVDAAVAGAADPFDPAALWTIVTGGDVMLDREVYRHAVILGKGADYPWDGGIARITSRTCCTRYGGPMITARRVRDKGAVRALLSGADIALVNHEGPALKRHGYHPDGLIFTFDPALEAGLRRAGIDIVSLANNHIRNAGSRGVVETIRHVREAGMASVGAGRDVEQARRGTCLEAAGQRVCFLAYVGYDTARNEATERRPGAAPLSADHVREDVARLRDEGADVVIVVPHWGLEYVERPTAAQRRLARVMVGSGADAVLGAHSHVVGTVQLIRGVPVLYSLGNLLFDHPRYERTLQGVLAELTFHGRRVVQLELHPTVLVNRSQVNLLEPDGDGRVVLRRIREAS